MSSPAAEKILILRFSSLGDIIMTTAMLRAVRSRFPNAEITLVVRGDFLDLVSHNPHLNRVIGLPRGEGMMGFVRLANRLRRETFDIVYDSHRSLRTLFLMPYLRAKKKFYYHKHYFKRGLALTFKFRILDRMRMLERFIEPLQELGVRYDGKGPEMFLSNDWEKKALKKVPLPSEKTVIGLIPSAQWEGKRWPSDRFREVTEKLLKENDAVFLIFGGKSDSFCEEIARGFPKDRVINAQGLLSLGESAALVKRCRLVVANDTGLMHVADALGVPSVLVFGPTSAEMGCLPFHPETVIVEKTLWCRPCSKNGQAPCIRGRRLCLLEIQASEVASAVGRLLLTRSPA